jgi:hypothetical protein
VKLLKSTREESERPIREGLTEDDLEILGIMNQDKKNNEETQKVRQVGHSKASSIS